MLIKNKQGKEIYRITTEDGLCSNNVNSLSYNGKGNLWGATDNGLFVIYVSPVFTHYDERLGLVGEVTSILNDGQHLYVGTLQGLYHLTPEKQFEKVEGINLACWQLTTSPNGTKFAATADGVYMHKDVTKHITTRHTLSLITLNDHVFLTGEIDGIYSNTTDGKTERLCDAQNVVKFERDADGGIWGVSLSRDTYYLAKGSKRFKKKENKNITVLFNYIDTQGRKWYQKKNRGLYCDDLNENQRRWCAPLSGYSIQAMDVNDNVVFVGGNFGLIRFDLNDMRRISTYKPTLHLRSFVENGNNVSFSFSNDKQDPLGKTQYHYRLQDGDKWIDCATDQDLSLVNMTSGNYQLTIRSQDTYGNVTMSKTTEFYVEPPFYLKWYMQVIYLLLVGGLIYWGIKWRLHRMVKEQMRLESLVNEKTQELRDAQNLLIRREREATIGKLTKGLIDRILNPMNYINNFSHITIGLAKDLKENIETEKEHMSEDNYEDSMDVLDMMQTNLKKIEEHGMSTTRIIKAMEEMLKERPEKKKENINLVSLCQQNIDVFSKYYEDDIKRYGIKVDFEHSENSITTNVIDEYLDKCVKLMLSNSIYAVKKSCDKQNKQNYTPVIKLHLTRDEKNKTTQLSIYDNGIGIEDTIQSKIFDPFFTTKPTGEAPGVGLYMAQHLMQDAGGTISMKSVKDEFTEFIISLP